MLHRRPLLRGGEQDVDGENFPPEDRREVVDAGVVCDGLGLLRLAPEAFWAMTPREFDRAARAYFGDGSDAPERTAFNRLMQKFPD